MLESWQTWEKICSAGDIAPGTAKIVDRGMTTIAIFNVEGEFYAMNNTCAHRGGPLGEGTIEKGNVTCPWHAWTFDIPTGFCRNPSTAKQKKYEVRVENGEIFVEIPS